MTSAVDTNVLLDILIPDAEYLDHSLAALLQAAEKGPLIISEIVFTELSSQFLHDGDLERFLAETAIELRISDEKALWIAGRAWKEYSKRRKNVLTCFVCGKEIAVLCPHCQQPVQPKRHVISDFIVGAHAMAFAGRLITRDRGFYRKYFKGLQIIDPMRGG